MGDEKRLPQPDGICAESFSHGMVLAQKLFNDGHDNTCIALAMFNVFLAACAKIEMTREEVDVYVKGALDHGYQRYVMTEQFDKKVGGPPKGTA